MSDEAHLGLEGSVEVAVAFQTQNHQTSLSNPIFSNEKLKSKRLKYRLVELDETHLSVCAGLKGGG
jgi:hypothetical protein